MAFEPLKEHTPQGVANSDEKYPTRSQQRIELGSKREIAAKQPEEAVRRSRGTATF
jgi:hypothetical protein